MSVMLRHPMSLGSYLFEMFVGASDCTCIVLDQNAVITVVCTRAARESVLCRFSPGTGNRESIAGL